MLHAVEACKGGGLGDTQGRLCGAEALLRLVFLKDKQEVPDAEAGGQSRGALSRNVTYYQPSPLALMVCFCFSYGDDRFCDQGLQLFIRGHPRAGGSHSLLQRL